MVVAMSSGIYHEKQMKRRVSTGSRTLRRSIKGSEDGSLSIDEDEIYKKKVKTLFLKADGNGNGWLEQSEVIIILNKLDMNSSEITTKLYKRMESTDMKISFEDFYDFICEIKNSIQKLDTEDNNNKNNIKNGDMDEVDYKARVRRKSLQRQETINLISQLSTCSSSGLRRLLQRTATHVEDTPAMDFIPEEVQEEEHEVDLSKFITERWDAFINFKRHGKDGEVVMTSDEQLTDALPGTYDLLQLVMDQFDSDVVANRPNHAIIKPVIWISAKDSSCHGQLLCPKYWNGTIPVEIGTEQNLSYYGCCYASKQQQSVALLHRHATVDFVYSENYKRNFVLQEEEGSGGCGLEKHAFHHMDCPLVDDSGYFLLAKVVDDNELHVTAFKIPRNHVLYVPPMVIHSNDHMRGKWRTMLADNVPIDHVHFMKETQVNGYYDNTEVTIEERN